MAKNNIFERIRESHAEGVYGTQKAEGRDKPRVLSRYMGGHNRDNHPFVSGYWQLILDPPNEIFGNVADLATTWWHCTAEGFTPPTRTLNKATVPGQGGLASNYVTGQTFTQTFTVTFREFQELPIFTLIQLWCSVIDPYTGVSQLSGDKWVPASYKGSCYAVLTKPSKSQAGKEITPLEVENIFYFHGVFPEAPPYDTLGSDIATNDVVQHSITFSFDGWPLTREDPEVVTQALKLLKSSKYVDHTYDNYLKDVTGTKIGDVVGSDAGAGGQ